jgi:DNA repair photolyase
MVLGALYIPSGMAFETAKAVLEVETPYASNVALGCTNNCSYCYVPKAYHTKAGKIRHPKQSPKSLVETQLNNPFCPKIEGVFLSFGTDPFLNENRNDTEELIRFLFHRNIRVATLSKIATDGCASNGEVRHGMTVVSVENKFRNQFEPNTSSPLTRVADLRGLKENWNQYVWVSMEPYPPSTIYKQNFQLLLEGLSFVDFIVFGKWNYSKSASTEEARLGYANNVEVLEDFCKANRIRYHVKLDTLKFIGRHAGN